MPERADPCATLCVMDNVGVRELRQNLSVHLRRVVEDGETLAVTDRGRPVALLTPLPDAHDVWARLVARGAVVRPATRWLSDLPPPLPAPPGVRPLTEIVDDERDDR